MPQEIGQNFRSVIPTLADNASIEEAFSMYHYGSAVWTQGQAIPSNSIEGVFSSLEERITNNENSILNLSSTYIATAPESTEQNVIQSTSVVYVPLTIRGAVGQTASLQEWVENTGSSLITKAKVSANGSFSTLGYMSIGSININPSVANNIQISASTNKGIVIKAAPSQTANLQEWQDDQGNVLLSVNNNGSFIYNTPIFYEPLNASLSLPPQLFTLESTITLSKMGKIVEISNPDPDTAHTVIVPNNSSESIPIGGKISYISTNDGDIQFSPEPGVTLDSENGYRKIKQKYSSVKLIKIALNEWVLLGSLKA